MKAPDICFGQRGHVNRGAPVGPADTPRPPKHPVLPPPLAGFNNKERGCFGGDTRLPPPTRPPSPPGLMHDSRRSCGAKWIPWHGAHERGLLVFFFLLTFIHVGRADEAHRRLHKLNISQRICYRASFSGSIRCSVILLLYFVSSRLFILFCQTGKQHLKHTKQGAVFHSSFGINRVINIQMTSSSETYRWFTC